VAELAKSEIDESRILAAMAHGHSAEDPGGDAGSV
jgi:hypothetical protein